MCFARFLSWLLIYPLFFNVPAIGGKLNFEVRAPVISDNKVSDIQENDLWAIRDLILMGYGAVFMKPGSQGMEEARQATVSLLDHLPLFHPVQKCRDAIDAVNQKYALNDDPQLRGGSSFPDLSMRIKEAAQASWGCLKGHPRLGRFSNKFFTGRVALRSEVVDNNCTDAQKVNDVAHDARNPYMTGEARKALSACRTTKWFRACSYWVSFHTMAFRADLMGMGQRFLQIIFPIVVSGALGCGGCTTHFRSINMYGLSKHLYEDFDERRLF
eukprot:TRINITY_DN3660_c0_g1_i1.p1 TRINITY_DN3660_c0_g1~~TRINITY_DN3660_c0_g1_i1.p1  ORF type:complete len:271 (+),score=34.49 TRINITY_DN3660_c0_g1_i1:33-845(+)